MAPFETRNPRFEHPMYLENATDFSKNRAELNPLWFVKTLKAQRQWWNELREATRLDEAKHADLTDDDLTQELADRARKAKGGRKRMKGDWALVYMAFVASKHPDFQPFWGTAGHSIWREAGFKERPSFAITHLRLTELEQFEPAFLACAQKIIQHAVKQSGGLIGRDLHVDATEAETNARLVHICDPSKPCMNRSRKPWIKDQQPRGTLVTAMMNTDEARKARQDQVAASEPDQIQDAGPNFGNVTDAAYDEQTGIFKLGDCEYRLLDPTAGVRAYTREPKKSDNPGDNPSSTTKKFWVGFYNGKMIDHYTGAPVGLLVTSATVNEADSYPDLYDRSVKATGQTPRAVVGDRGYHIDKVYEHNTRRGVASIFAYKQPGEYDDRSDEDNDDWDRHGVPRCRHCGGPTTFMRFDQHHHSGPRLVVRCQTPLRGCPDDQRIQCSRKWRLLVPMWRNEPAYQALRGTHDQYERVHLHWRKRWRVGADDHELRPKRRGIECQQLRATAALIAEWLVILWREGWLGSARKRLRRNTGEPVTQDFTREAFEFDLYRRSMGLLFSYGSRAEKLELIPPDLPPSVGAA